MDFLLSPTLEQVQQARERLLGYIFQTPIVTNDQLNERLDCTAFWKIESFQQTNAFKVRGALNRVLSLTDRERRRGVVAVSSGNHGIGVSFAAKAVSIPAKIFMPVNAPRVKQEKVRQYGASIVRHGNNYNEALALAEEYACANNLPLVSSFDDPNVVAGQGTITLEILEELGEVDDLVVPIGGGGLAAGTGIVLNALKPSARVYGVQPKAAPSCYESCLAGKQVTALPAQTLADGLVCTKPGELTFPIIQRTVHDILLVDEPSIMEALNSLLNVLKIIVEPAAAVSLAAIQTHREIFSKRRVGCILTGGNIDPEVLNQVLCSNAARREPRLRRKSPAS